MNNTTLQLKVKERINKLDSLDYDNIACWKIVESFNKAQIEWARRQIRGSNPFNDGDEGSVRRIDDLQKLLIDTPLQIIGKDLFYESLLEIPGNFLEYKRVDVYASDECCKEPRSMIVYLAEEDNRAQLLRDVNKKPSFEWGETFSTLIDNKIRIFTNNDFELEKARFTYYRKPVNIQIEGCRDPYTLDISPTNIESEFKDDIVELIIDEAVYILAGDIESIVQAQRTSTSAERSN
jgi:hypothetical protein